MQSLFDINGLMFWDETSIGARRRFESYFAKQIQNSLREMNKAFEFFHIDAPTLTPIELINAEYNGADIYIASLQLALRPETTAGSYRYAEFLLEHQHRPPFVVWQAGKSFRKEQDQVLKNVRLKEFYQQEFQCFYSIKTKNDYQANILEPLRNHFQRFFKAQVYIIESDRLPSYSLKTIDFMVNGMEICSCSVRTDFSDSNILVLEIAIGLDRCVYQWLLD